MRFNHARPLIGQRTITGLTLAVALLVLAVFFRQQILNRFGHLSGDRYDGVIQVALLEHWFNVFRGWSHWATPNYFYPYPNTLGYNEGLFLNGVLYSLFRAASLDVFLANELTNIVIKGVGFFGFMAAARRMLKLPVEWALLGAAIFTLSNNSFMQLSHAQLLSVSLAPVEALLIYNAAQALLLSQGRRLLVFGSLAALLFAAWMMSCLYTAWFFAVLAVVAVAFQLLLRGLPGLKQLGHAVIVNKGALLGIALVAALSLLPFISVYLGAGRQRPWSEILFYIPSLFDSFNVGTGNAVFGDMITALHAGCQMCDLGSGEREAGIAPVLLLLAGMCILDIFRRRLPLPADVKTIMVGIAAASLILWLLSIRFDQDTGWAWLYHYWPGGGGLRVVSRIFLLLTLPATALAAWYLSRSSWSPLVLLAVSALLLAEEINHSPITTLDRQLLLDRTSGVPPAPAECRAFFTTASPDTVDGDSSFPVGSLYPHNVDAMLIAELVHLPTINGFASFNPPDWNFAAPAAPDYLLRVQAYAKTHQLQGLCQLDLTSKRWHTRPVYVTTRARLGYWDLASKQLPAERLRGFGPAEPFGRWTEGREASFQYVLPAKAERATLSLKINLITAMVNDRHSQRVVVSVDGGEKHEFVFKTTARATIALTVPAPASTQGEIHLELPDAVSPRELGINADPRQLAIGVKSIEIE
ncbi:DUF7024 domain-containing protein [Duganella radicis]|uniref:DUF7024 domain-containing protein n=1 Tax=Duganella radicis TaxID=551988 RepID=A0A6L6PPA5_9BURK|nr:hypothetical protein [Duganella radicis]MTV40742.1 hypothetical protein [Duganella radicis]